MNEWARAACELLLNCLWQGTALAALTACVLRIVPGVSAAARYAVWYAALVGLVLLPAANVGLPAPAGEAPLGQELPRGGSSEPPAAVRPALPEKSGGRPVMPAQIALSGGWWTLWLPAAWASAALWMMLRLARCYRAVGRLKRDSIPLAGPEADLWVRRFRACFAARRVELRCSERVNLPLLAGLLRPAILFPAPLVGRLSADEKYRICLHELAHLRRLDDWTKLGQKLIEAALFFHPAVRWMGRRLELEREIACDDWVVRVSGAARPYAACLTRLAELACGSPGSALSTAGNHTQIFRRIEMLLDKNRTSKSRSSRAAFAATLALFLAAVAALARMTPLVAVQASPAQETKAAPKSEPAPEPDPKPSPVPQTRSAEARLSREEAAREIARRAEQVAKAIRPHQQEIQRLTEEIQRHVQQEIRVNTEQIQELTQKIQAEVESSMQPHIREIEKLAARLAQEHAKGGKPDDEAVRKLEADIRRHEEEGIRQAEERIRKLESEIRSYEETIRPSEEQIRALELKIRAIEEKIREKERELEGLERQIEERPAEEGPPQASRTPPAPPAKPVPRAAPMPPAVAAPPPAPLTPPAPPAKPVPHAAPVPPAVAAPPVPPAPPAPRVEGGVAGGTPEII